MCNSGVDDFPDGRRRHAAGRDAPRVRPGADRRRPRRKRGHHRAASPARRGRRTPFRRRLPRLAARPSRSWKPSSARSSSRGKPSARCTSSTSARRAGIELVAGAKAQGLNISCETCPHYLILTEADVERLGPLAKCAPPLRTPRRAGRALGAARRRGRGHDRLRPFARAAGDQVPEEGPLRLVGRHRRVPIDPAAHAHRRARPLHPLPLERLSELLATNAARRFRLHPAKGEIRQGADADLVIVNVDATDEVREENLLFPLPGALALPGPAPAWPGVAHDPARRDDLQGRPHRRAARRTAPAPDGKRGRKNAPRERSSCRQEKTSGERGPAQPSVRLHAHSVQARHALLSPDGLVPRACRNGRARRVTW